MTKQCLIFTPMAVLLLLISCQKEAGPDDRAISETETGKLVADSIVIQTIEFLDSVSEGALGDSLQLV